MFILPFILLKIQDYWCTDSPEHRLWEVIEERLNNENS